MIGDEVVVGRGSMGHVTIDDPMLSLTPFGEMPIDDFIGSVWIDPLAHAWDIADAAGIDPGIDDETAAKASAILDVTGPILRSVGAIAEPVEGGRDAAARFAGDAGRASVRG